MFSELCEQLSSSWSGWAGRPEQESVSHRRNHQPPALSSEVPHLYLATPPPELLYYAHLLATKQLVYIDMERTKLGSDNSSWWLLPIDVPPWDELAFGAVLEGCGGSVELCVGVGAYARSPP